MGYQPGHSSLVAYAPSAGVITESSDGLTPATLPAIPSSPILIGYTNVPARTGSFNNAKGYASGTARGVYEKRGRIENELSFEIRLAALGMLQKCFPDSTTGALPQIDLFVGVQGEPCTVLRFAKCSQIAFNYADGDAEASELTATPTFWAIANQVGSPLTATPSQIRAIGTPLFWHDVRSLTIKGTNYRWYVRSQTWTQSYNLERKHCRQNWGDNVPLSRTPYELMEHLTTVSGETGLSQKLPAALFNDAANAQSWGPMAIYASTSSAPGVGETAKGFTVTASGVMPVSESQDAVSVSEQMTHTVSVVADELVLAID